jgi:hypothetical protein
MPIWMHTGPASLPAGPGPPSGPVTVVGVASRPPSVPPGPGIIGVPESLPPMLLGIIIIGLPPLGGEPPLGLLALLAGLAASAPELELPLPESSLPESLAASLPASPEPPPPSTTLPPLPAHLPLAQLSEQQSPNSEHGSPTCLHTAAPQTPFVHVSLQQSLDCEHAPLVALHAGAAQVPPLGPRSQVTLQHSLAA